MDEEDLFFSCFLVLPLTLSLHILKDFGFKFFLIIFITSDSFFPCSRLSFFLWCSIPDEELLLLAEQGKLQDPKVLAQQVDRMLNDRRVKNFCDSFAPQWLKINNIVSASPDFKLYRDYYFGGDDKISYKRGMHMMLETTEPTYFSQDKCE